MKNFYNSAFLLFLACSSLIAKGQITITNADMPNLQDTYVRANAVNLEGFDFSETGADHTWDFSSLESLNTNEQNFVSVSDAPFAYQFLFNNPFDDDYVANLVIETEGFDTGTDITLDDFYQFYKLTDDAYSIVGYGATISGFPVPAKTEPIDVVYSLPIEYGDTHNSYSEWLIEIPSLATYLLKQDRSYEVDGYGTLILPEGTYDVLRLKMDIAAQDSLVIPQFEIDVEFDRESVEYHWLALGEGVPVLQATETFGVVSGITYKSEEVIDNVFESPVFSFAMYPNPAENLLWITTGSSESSKVRVTDAFGKLAMDELSIAGNAPVAIDELTTGVYFVQCSNALGTSIQRLVKR
ncbi:MAG: T9SS type A sorting domain-containing protein [Flavobacteriales bacterium]